MIGLLAPALWGLLAPPRESKVQTVHIQGRPGELLRPLYTNGKVQFEAFVCLSWCVSFAPLGG